MIVARPCELLRIPNAFDKGRFRESWVHP
jgi:hypothetical protein